MLRAGEQGGPPAIGLRDLPGYMASMTDLPYYDPRTALTITPGLMEAAIPFFSRDDFAGKPSSRVYRPTKKFEAAVDRVLGERIRADGACGVDLWCALAGVEWRDRDGNTVRYSFRTAGDLVAWVREEGGYIEWYGSGDNGVVADWISEGLAEAGWSWMHLQAAVSDGSLT